MTCRVVLLAVWALLAPSRQDQQWIIVEVFPSQTPCESKRLQYAHGAGVPPLPEKAQQGPQGFTRMLCENLGRTGRKIGN